MIKQKGKFVKTFLSKIFSSKTTLLIRIVIIIISFLTPTTTKAMPFFKEKLPTTPISVPFDFTKKYEKVDLSFKIIKKEKFGYSFLFSFTHKAHKKNLREKIYEQLGYAEAFIGMFFGVNAGFFDPKPIPKYEVDDMERVEKLAGGYVIEGGKVVEYQGVSMSVNIEIIEIEEGKERRIFNKNIEPYGFNSSSKNVVDIDLKPGLYRVIMTSLKALPELTGTEINFIITENRSVNESKIIQTNQIY
jgi:hypothetical protein